MELPWEARVARSPVFHEATRAFWDYATAESTKVTYSWMAKSSKDKIKGLWNKNGTPAKVSFAMDAWMFQNMLT